MKNHSFHLFSNPGQSGRIASFIVLSALSAFLFFSSFTPPAGGATGSGPAAAKDDPDIAPGLTGGIDKHEYLLRRAEQIALYRGWERGKPFDLLARGRALHEM
jgi:hypothetical protein